MNTRAFMLLLVGVLVLGGSLGGAFVGGIVLGKSQGDETAQSSLLAQSPLSIGDTFSGQLSQGQLEQLRQRIQSGDINQDDLDQLRQQLRGQFSPGAGGLGLAGRGGLTGTIEKIEGDTVTINTPQGALQATIGADTSIQLFTEGELSDLVSGMTVTIVGQRGEDGTVEASSILITPEGAGGVFAGSFLEGRQQRDQQSP